MDAFIETMNEMKPELLLLAVVVLGGWLIGALCGEGNWPWKDDHHD